MEKKEETQPDDCLSYFIENENLFEIVDQYLSWDDMVALFRTSKHFKEYLLRETSTSNFWSRQINKIVRFYSFCFKENMDCDNIDINRIKLFNIGQVIIKVLEANPTERTVSATPTQNKKKLNEHNKILDIIINSNRAYWLSLQSSSLLKKFFHALYRDIFSNLEKNQRLLLQCIMQNDILGIGALLHEITPYDLYHVIKKKRQARDILRSPDYQSMRDFLFLFVFIYFKTNGKENSAADNLVKHESNNLLYWSIVLDQFYFFALHIWNKTSSACKNEDSKKNLEAIFDAYSKFALFQDITWDDFCDFKTVFNANLDFDSELFYQEDDESEDQYQLQEKINSLSKNDYQDALFDSSELQCVFEFFKEVDLGLIEEKIVPYHAKKMLSIINARQKMNLASNKAMVIDFFEQLPVNIYSKLECCYEKNGIYHDNDEKIMLLSNLNSSIDISKLIIMINRNTLNAPFFIKKQASTQLGLKSVKMVQTSILQHLFGKSESHDYSKRVADYVFHEFSNNLNMNSSAEEKLDHDEDEKESQMDIEQSNSWLYSLLKIGDLEDPKFLNIFNKIITLKLSFTTLCSDQENGRKIKETCLHLILKKYHSLSQDEFIFKNYVKPAITLHKDNNTDFSLKSILDHQGKNIFFLALSLGLYEVLDFILNDNIISNPTSMVLIEEIPFSIKIKNYSILSYVLYVLKSPKAISYFFKQNNFNLLSLNEDALSEIVFNLNILPHLMALYDRILVLSIFLEHPNYFLCFYHYMLSIKKKEKWLEHSEESLLLNFLFHQYHLSGIESFIQFPDNLYYHCSTLSEKKKSVHKKKAIECIYPYILEFNHFIATQLGNPPLGTLPTLDELIQYNRKTILNVLDFFISHFSLLLYLNDDPHTNETSGTKLVLFLYEKKEYAFLSKMVDPYLDKIDFNLDFFCHIIRYPDSKSFNLFFQKPLFFREALIKILQPLKNEPDSEPISYAFKRYHTFEELKRLNNSYIKENPDETPLDKLSRFVKINERGNYSTILNLIYLLFAINDRETLDYLLRELKNFCLNEYQSIAFTDYLLLSSVALLQKNVGLIECLLDNRVQINYPDEKTNDFVYLEPDSFKYLSLLFSIMCYNWPENKKAFNYIHFNVFRHINMPYYIYNPYRKSDLPAYPFSLNQTILFYHFNDQIKKINFDFSFVDLLMEKGAQLSIDNEKFNLFHYLAGRSSSDYFLVDLFKLLKNTFNFLESKPIEMKKMLNDLYLEKYTPLALYFLGFPYTDNFHAYDKSLTEISDLINNDIKIIEEFITQGADISLIMEGDIIHEMFMRAVFVSELQKTIFIERISLIQQKMPGMLNERKKHSPHKGLTPLMCFFSAIQSLTQLHEHEFPKHEYEFPKKDFEDFLNLLIKKGVDINAISGNTLDNTQCTLLDFALLKEKELNEKSTIYYDNPGTFIVRLITQLNGKTFSFLKKEILGKLSNKIIAQLKCYIKKQKNNDLNPNVQVAKTLYRTILREEFDYSIENNTKKIQYDEELLDINKEYEELAFHHDTLAP